MFLTVDYFKKYGDSSGGTLNDICDKFHIASRKNSIAVISLQQKHRIFSAEELLSEIDRHYHEDCECGLKATNTIQMMANNLYMVQDKPQAQALLKEKGEEMWDIETCHHWMKNLMGKNSFRGKKMEDEAIRDMKEHIWKYKIEKSDEETDVAGACDLVVKQNEVIVAGIQVKPESFYHKNLTYVKELQDKLEYPVHDLVYDRNGDWKNFLATISNFL